MKLKNLASRRGLVARLLEDAGINLSQAAKILPRQNSDGLPLSFAQQRLWFLDQFGSGSAVYNISYAVRLKGELDIPALERSLTEIVRRHEVLRTTFSVKDGKAVQVIKPARQQRFCVVELSELGELKEEESRRLISEVTQMPFDLEQGPTLRAALLRSGEQEHITVLVLHHIVSDGWSRGVLARELTVLYRAYTKGEESPLPEPPIQYADYAVWQRNWLQGAVLEKQLGYWKKQLAGAPSLLELPTDRARPAVQSYRGAVREHLINNAVTEKLRELSRREGTTLFMTLLAAFNTLLYRYTGRPDIIVGSPIANRTRAETQGMMGFFINTLVLRTDLSGDPTFIGLLKRVREVALEAYAHQDLPFERLVDELDTQRSLSYAPLFQVVFVLQNPTTDLLQLPGLQLSEEENLPGTSKFDLTVQLVELSGGLQASAEYSTALFDGETIERMLRHFENLLCSIVEDERQEISKLALLSEPEQQQILVEWNDTPVDYPKRPIHQIIEAQVEKTPDAAAVIFEQQRVTYEALNKRANQLAHYLRSKGVGPESIVAVRLERSMEMVIALLGILKAGGAYLPLDGSQPLERLALMAADAGVRLAITEQREAGRVEEFGAEQIDILRDSEAIAGQSEKNPVNEVRGENAAYVIYTSGSTGRPKGVINTHQGISNRLQWMQQQYGLDATDAVMQKTPYSFDVSVWEFFWPLMTGACVVVAKPGGHRDSSYLVELINQYQVTTIHFVPSMLQAFLSEGQVESCTSLKRVISSGQALSEELVNKFNSKLECPLHNLYGPTEAAVDVTFWECRATKNGRIPIGKPIANTQMYILDEKLQPAPAGVAGEIFISGEGLARGYINSADQTAERFVPNRFATSTASRMYRTGDLGRYLSTGDIEFIGRMDNQVKIRGYRIEPGEIETALLAHSSVKDAVVVARTVEGVGERLVAYVVSETEGAAAIPELRAHLKEKLPEYMVPAAIVMIDEIPLTANGKVNRKSLPEPSTSRPHLGQQYVSPETLEEQVLAAIWTHVLKIESVGVEDNFFAMGGDSISSIQVVAMAKQRGIGFSLQEMFQHQTIRELAGALGRGGEGREAAKTERMGLISEEDRQKMPENIEDAYPLTMLQAGMVYHMELTPDSPVYHNVDSMRLKMRYDHAAFEEAVEAVVNRHAVLRTSFDMTSYSEPLQLVHREAKLEIGVTDIREKSEEDQETEIDEFVTGEGKRRFDYRKAPLIRFYIHRRSDEEIQFTLTESHVINDGWSLHSTLAEIFEHYFALIKGEEPPKGEPLRVSFRDYVAMERAAVESEECQRYWDEKLADCNVMALPPVSATEIDNDGPRIGVVSLDLGKDVTEALRKLARQATVPIKSVLLAAHLKVMSLISGQSDLVTGFVCNGRPEEEGGAQVRGLFLNTLPLRYEIAGGTWEQLVKDVFQAEWELLPYRWYPMANIQRRWGRQPLFEVAFNYIHFHVVDGVLKSGDLEVLGFKGAEETNLPMIINFDNDLLSSEARLRMAYDRNKVSDEQAHAIKGYFERVLKAMADDQTARHESQSYLAPEEEQVLLERNTLPDLQGADKTIHCWFEQQAARSADAIAVTFEGEQLTYGELNERANQLAHYLRKLGVGPETLVAVYLDRSIKMIVAILGVLKAGGAYLPLEMLYPQQRLSFIINDTQAPALVTEAALLKDLPEYRGHVICVDLESDLIAREDCENPVNTTGPDETAYVIYTSGSTGGPKGVVVSHSNVVRLFTSTASWFQFNAEDVWSCFHSYAFDFSVWEVFGALLYGGRLVIVPHWISRSPGLFYDLLRRERVTVLNQTPSAFRQLAGFEEPVDSAIMLNLRVVIFGGESLDVQSLESWVNRHGDQHPRLINMYGITEGTVHTTYRPVTMLDMKGISGSVIGRQIPDVQLYLLDRHLQPVPIGTPGEMYIGGAGVTRGYLNRPEPTAERFVPSPFGILRGARLYKTGDLARYLADGDIEYLGRIDHQVKVRGFRIELGEIEAALLAHPSVKDVVVVASGIEGSEKRLVAYVVSEMKSVAISELRAHLKEKLPEYMLPWMFVQVDEIPLTPNGKVDRRALPEPSAGRPELGQAYVRPRIAEEEVLAAIWSQVLNVKEVGTQDNFYELGGDSIRSIQVLAMARQRGLVFSLQELFQHPTVGELATIARRGGENKQVSRSEAMSMIRELDRRELPEGIEDAYPLTKLQEGMLYHMELTPNNPVYHNVHSIRLRMKFEYAAFEAAVREVVKRHSILRTSFDLTTYSGPMQLVHRDATLEIRVGNIAHLSKVEQERSVDKLIKREKNQPFALSKAPLMRFHIFIRSEDTIQFTFTDCHAIQDGWSLHNTLIEIFNHYLALLNNRPLAEEDPPAVTFKDYVALEREALMSEEIGRYWEEKLSGYTMAELPHDAPALANGNPRVGTRQVAIPVELSEGAKLFAKQAAVPIKSVLLAAHLKVMSLIGGQRDVVTGLLMNGRPEEIGGEQVRGLFLNLLPLRFRLTRQTWYDLIREAFDAETEMLPYRWYPMAAIQRKLGGRALFETAFNFMHFPFVDEFLKSNDVEVLEFKGQDEAHLTLQAHFNLAPLTSAIGLSLEYDKSKLSERQIDAVSAYYLRVLVRMVNDSSQRHSSQSYLLPEEDQKLIAGWNQTFADYPKDCIHRVFEHQAERTPQAVAIVFEEEQITYEALNKRANQLAHYLRSKGVGPESIVSVRLERSIEMVIALLGILKAGGAYLPLDGSQPLERLALMAADAGVRLAITQQREAGRVEEFGAEQIDILRDSEAISGQSEKNPVNEVRGENAAYVMYTSGSTGQPKGVVGLHGATMNRLRWMWERFPFTAREVCCQKTNLSFVDSVWEIFGPLLGGVRTVIIGDEEAKDPEKLAEAIARNEVSRIVVVPTLLRAMMERVKDVGEKLGGLRMCVSSGEALGVELSRRFKETMRECRLLNLYGSTEVGADASWYEVSGGGEEGRVVAIGEPISNTRMYVVDEEQQLAGEGVKGELMIGGEGLARGYLNRADMTGERFLPEPFSGEEGARMYRTGDVVRRRGDGVIEYIGRADQQVKMRGYRIELGEVEWMLKEHESVEESVVVMREEEGEGRLEGYVVMREGDETSASELRSYVKGRLPEYMVPGVIVKLEQMPLSANGKVDRGRLPRADVRDEEIERRYEGPRSAVEEVVARIWAEVLKLERVGINDNFFALGGHSLLATQIISRVRVEFQMEIALSKLFEVPTVAQLSEMIEESGKEVEAEMDSISDALKMTELLPDEEIAALLAAETQVRKRTHHP